MWDTPFDTDMIGEHHKVVVNCPDEDLERELSAILTAFGITYPNGDNLLKKSFWKEYMDDFCYYIDGLIVRRGPKHSAESGPWSKYEKTTFYGEQQAEDISEESFAAILRR